MYKTELVLHPESKTALDTRIFGNFIEHIESCILGGGRRCIKKKQLH